MAPTFHPKTFANATISTLSSQGSAIAPTYLSGFRKAQRCGWALCTTLLVLLLSVPMLAIDRDRRIDELYHIGWTAKDGVPGQIHKIAQTADGFLWLGTENGLFRFDGVHFEHYEPKTGPAFAETKIIALLATPDGGLWISFSGGHVSFLKDGHVVNYGQRDGLIPSPVYQLLRDSHGQIWAIAYLGITRFDGVRWKKINGDQDVQGAHYSALIDRNDTLWVSARDGVFFLPAGADKFQVAADQRTSGMSMAEARDGALWIAQTERSVHTVPLPWKRPTARTAEVRVGSMAILIDSHGSLWIATAGDGLRRVPYPERLYGSSVAQFGPEAEIFTHNQGLSSDFVFAILEDREGNVWVATNEGLDCFRQTAFVPVTLASGTSAVGLAAGDHGMVWASAMNRGLMRIQDGKAVADSRLGQTNVHAISRMRDGSLWIGTDKLQHFTNDHLDRQIASPGGRPIAIAEDSLQRLWVTISPEAVLRFNDGRWQSLRSLGGPSGQSFSTFTDEQGILWFGFENNTLAKIDGDSIHVYSAQDGIQIGTVASIQGRHSDLWIGGPNGLVEFDGKAFRPVLGNDGHHFKDVLAVVATDSDGIWFRENRGIVQIPSSEVEQFLKDPHHGVSYRLFDFLDGLPSAPQATMIKPGAVQGTDGRIWFALTQGLAWVDPKHIPNNAIAPTLSIDRVDANGVTLDSSSLAKLAAHTTALRIAYTASSLSIPERVRFRYRLEGIDTAWNDAGTRREAFYTNLSPGSYRFHVIACNNDGVWNDAGATWDFIIAPAFYQTTWFKALLGFVGLGLIWLMHSLRLGQATEQMKARLGERLEERGRIARELHDTLIQSVDGLMLRLQTALDEPNPERSHLMIEKALDSADEVMLEGRQRVHALRAEAITINELSEAVASYGRELAEEHAIAFSVTLVGSPRPVDPFVRDEAYRIGREALGNAFQHADAKQIEVEVTYDRRELRIRVRDNGRGLDEKTLNAGRPGHWGLHGMRERAHVMGGKLVIWSRLGLGTEIDLQIPADVAYEKGILGLNSRWIKRLAGDRRVVR